MSTKQKEASKATSKRIRSLKEEKAMKEFAKATKSIHDKKEGLSKELAYMQLEDAMEGKNLSPKSLKKVAEPAGDDQQLTRTLRKFQRDIFKVGGRAGFKAGSKGCKLAKRGKGRAYGKNS